MTGFAHSPLQRQVARASRRLFLQTLVNHLAGCCAVGLGLGIGWFLIEPYLLIGSAPWLRWAVAGGLLGAGMVMALSLAIWKRPTALTAALSIDQKFGLKERVTTSLMLESPQLASPAGQALLADANQRVSEIDVGSRFPIRVNWTAALVPIAALLLAVVAVFYEVPKTEARTTHDDQLAQAPVNKEKLEENLKKFTKKEKPNNPNDPANSPKLKEYEDDIDTLLNKAREDQDQLRDRIKEAGRARKGNQEEYRAEGRKAESDRGKTPTGRAPAQETEK